MRSATRKKTGKDPEYLRWLRTLPCAVRECSHCRGLMRTWDVIEAAHVGLRGLSQKCPDREAVRAFNEGCR